MDFTRPELLLHPNIPKPLHGLNPRSILGKKWWDEKRKEAYAIHNDHCWACGIHKSKQLYKTWLEGHESYDIDYNTGKVVLKEIVALCHACHQFIHNGYLYVRYSKGEVSYNYAYNIMRHGMGVLQKAGLKPHPHAALHYLLITGRTKDEADTIVIERGLLDEYDPPSRMAAWHEWHLEIDGETYQSLFKDFDEWQAYYGG